MDDIKITDALSRMKSAPPPKKEQKVRKRINSGAKGDGWEKAIAYLFTRRFGREFEKMPDSGARGTTGRLDQRAKEVLTSDIICPEGFNWTLECKKGYDIDLWSVFESSLTKGRKKDIDHLEYFTKQALDESYRVGKKPLVIYRKDNRPAVVMLKDSRGGAEVISAVKPETMMSWNGWYIISLHDMLLAPNHLFFDASACPDAPVDDEGWQTLLGGQVKTRELTPLQKWERALNMIITAGLNLRDLLKVPEAHPLRNEMMPDPYSDMTVNEFIEKCQPPGWRAQQVKKGLGL